METRRWQPRTEFTRQEQFLMKRLVRTRKLFGFLRNHRLELFDDEFQAELEAMYRDTGAGRAPVAPALVAMAVLLRLPWRCYFSRITACRTPKLSK